MVFSQPFQTPTMESFAKIGYVLKALIIFAKRSILDVLQGSEYTLGTTSIKL